MTDSNPVHLTVFAAPVVLEPAEGVFMPTSHGQFYARSIRVAPGERVIDIGTGSGVLAIAAAKVGARAAATDIDDHAVAAAQRNAALNGVDVEVRRGRLFADFAGPFDVILANLPNEIVAPSYLAELAAVEAQTFAGGERGNQHLLALLDEATRYMHGGSRLYLGVHSLTDYHETFRAAMERYDVRLVDFAALPAKPFVTAHLDFYRALNDAGVIHIFQAPGGEWHTFAYLCELTLPRAERGA